MLEQYLQETTTYLSKQWDFLLQRRMKGKGRRCCAVDRIDSIPFRAIAILHQDDLKNRMNSSFSSNHTGNSSFLQLVLWIHPFFKSSCKFILSSNRPVNASLSLNHPVAKVSTQYPRVYCKKDPPPFLKLTVFSIFPLTIFVNKVVKKVLNNLT